MKTITRTTIRKAVVTGFIASFLLSQNSFANNEKNTPKETALQYAGSINNTPVFRLAINNDAVETYLIKIRDVDGEILFSEKIKGNNITRTYQLNAEYYDLIEGTTVEVTNLKNNRSTFYKIEMPVITTKNIVVAEF